MTTNTATAASRGLGIPISRASFAEREGRTLPKAPVRIVHLGLGAFARAHQAWYTAQPIPRTSGASPRSRVAGLRPRMVAPQDGLYSLIERSPDSDSIGIVGSIVEAWDGRVWIGWFRCRCADDRDCDAHRHGRTYDLGRVARFRRPVGFRRCGLAPRHVRHGERIRPVGVPAPGDGPQTALTAAAGAGRPAPRGGRANRARALRQHPR